MSDKSAALLASIYESAPGYEPRESPAYHRLTAPERAAALASMPSHLECITRAVWGHDVKAATRLPHHLYTSRERYWEWRARGWSDAAKGHKLVRLCVVAGGEICHPNPAIWKPAFRAAACGIGMGSWANRWTRRYGALLGIGAYWLDEADRHIRRRIGG